MPASSCAKNRHFSVCGVHSAVLYTDPDERRSNRSYWIEGMKRHLRVRSLSLRVVNRLMVPWGGGDFRVFEKGGRRRRGASASFTSFFVLKIAIFDVAVELEVGLNFCELASSQDQIRVAAIEDQIGEDRIVSFREAREMVLIAERDEDVFH